MASLPKITLYDGTSLLKERTISPYVVRIKLLLNYKKIPYETVWIDYSDIETVCKSVGAPPTSTKADGSPYYTIPFMTVTPPAPAPSFALSDSATIAAFLDETFTDPDQTHPRELLPADTRIFQAVFRESLRTIHPALGPVLRTFVATLTTPEWYTASRKATIGRALEEITPVPGDAASEAAAWAGFDAGFDVIAGRLDVLGAGNFRVVKDRASYSEMEVVSVVNFIRSVSPDMAWKRLEGRNGGRWPKLLELYEDYLPKPVR